MGCGMALTEVGLWLDAINGGQAREVDIPRAHPPVPLGWRVDQRVRQAKAGTGA